MTQAPDTVHETITVAAAELIVAHGDDGVAMRKIAAAAGISKPGLYYHFRDKEALLEAVLTHWMAETEALVATVQQAPTIRTQLTILVRDPWIHIQDQPANAVTIVVMLKRTISM